MKLDVTSKLKTSTKTIVSDENMARYSFPTAERLAVAVNHLIN